MKDDANPLAQTVRAKRVSAPPPNAEPKLFAHGSDDGRAVAERGLTDSPGPSGCPGDETLIGLVEKTLAGERVAALADHVDHCERCRATVGALAGSDDLPATTTRVGRYELRDQLGSGGMGIVWRAWDPMLERLVAIKLLRPEAGEHGSARMLREARAAAKLSHPHVVAVHDVGEHEGGVFIATELVEGEALDVWQREKPASAIVEIYVQACRGLAAAHAIGLVHRDVKPSNILVGRDGRARVGDFGLARPVALDGDAATTALTHTGHVVGTPAYMAPEQRAALPVDARADQYSLCVALGEALGGTRPRPETAAAELRVEPRYAAAIARGLRIDPDERWPDLGALAAALTAPERAASSRGARAWIAGGVVVAAAATAAIVIGMRGPADRTAGTGEGDGQLAAAGAGTAGTFGGGEIGGTDGTDRLGNDGTGSLGILGSDGRLGNDGSDGRLAHGSLTGSNGSLADRGDVGSTGTNTGAGGTGTVGTGTGTVGNGNVGNRGGTVGNGTTNGTITGNNGNNGNSTVGTGSNAGSGAPATSPGSPQGGNPSTTAAWAHYVDAMQRVGARDPRCRASFAAFDAAPITLPAQFTPHQDALARGRCELIAGQCTAGAARITALYTAEGMSKPAITEEVTRETHLFCPTTPTLGTWQDRLQRLLTQAALLQQGSLADLTTTLANAEAIVRDAKGRAAMSRSERIDLSNAVLWLAAGFARLDGHCGEARRARALSDYDPMVMTEPLKICLTTTNP